MAPQKKKKVAKKSGSNIFDNFTQKQVAEFKEGFRVMDKDKDGFLGKEDLKATFAELGRPGTDDDFQQMLSDSPNPITFTTLLNMFAQKSSGEVDEDEVVAAAFRSFESATPGKIDPDQFRSMLMAFGNKFTNEEVDEVFTIMEMDDAGLINSNHLVGLLVAKES
ncbi:unnamed protein product [Meganyctiphanes norvegica]|uniref:EF-hand domain-containing protein n=1 Tax=Meganyctiphanes norvegica TaxID=48144 RepID=A0AAV2SHT8_MEGNR